MTLFDKLNYIITKLQEENYPILYTYSLYKDSKHIATITTENEEHCLVYNDYICKKPNSYYTIINGIKVLEPLQDCFVIVFNENIMYFVTF